MRLCALLAKPSPKTNTRKNAFKLYVCTVYTCDACSRCPHINRVHHEGNGHLLRACALCALFVICTTHTHTDTHGVGSRNAAIAHQQSIKCASMHGTQTHDSQQHRVVLFVNVLRGRPIHTCGSGIVVCFVSHACTHKMNDSFICNNVHTLRSLRGGHGSDGEGPRKRLHHN